MQVYLRETGVIVSAVLKVQLPKLTFGRTFRLRSRKVTPALFRYYFLEILHFESSSCNITPMIQANQSLALYHNQVCPHSPLHHTPLTFAWCQAWLCPRRPCRTKFTSWPRPFHHQGNKILRATLAGAPISLPIAWRAVTYQPTFYRARKVKCNRLPGQEKVCSICSTSQGAEALTFVMSSVPSNIHAHRYRHAKRLTYLCQHCLSKNYPCT
jgi:hypothetical protein